MKKALLSVFVCALSSVAFAQQAPDLNGKASKFFMRGYAKPDGGSSQNLLYPAGGSVIRNANVVLIFWGPSFAQAGSADNSYAQQIQAFRNQFGTTGEYRTTVQYY